MQSRDKFITATIDESETVTTIEHDVPANFDEYIPIRTRQGRPLEPETTEVNEKSEFETLVIRGE